MLSAPLASNCASLCVCVGMGGQGRFLQGRPSSSHPCLQNTPPVCACPWSLYIYIFLCVMYFSTILGRVFCQGPTQPAHHSLLKVVRFGLNMVLSFELWILHLELSCSTDAHKCKTCLVLQQLSDPRPTLHSRLGLCECFGEGSG